MTPIIGGMARRLSSPVFVGRSDELASSSRRPTPPTSGAPRSSSSAARRVSARAVSSAEVGGAAPQRGLARARGWVGRARRRRPAVRPHRGSAPGPRPQRGPRTIADAAGPEPARTRPPRPRARRASRADPPRPPDRPSGSRSGSSKGCSGCSAASARPPGPARHGGPPLGGPLHARPAGVPRAERARRALLHRRHVPLGRAGSPPPARRPGWPKPSASHGWSGSTSRGSGVLSLSSC